jgi:hypothetical protein
MWASQSIARSPATVGLVSGSCSSARAFAPRFFQAPPRGECCFTLAFRYDFTSIRLSKGLSPSSCRTCSAHNADARLHAGVKAGDVVTIMLEPDTEKREIEIPVQLQRALGAKLTEKLNCLSFTHKKEFVVWYSEAKQEDTRARRVEKMKQMLAAGKVIS